MVIWMNDFIERLMEIGKIKEVQAYCNNNCKKYDDITKCESPCEDIKEYFDTDMARKRNGDNDE